MNLRSSNRLHCGHWTFFQSVLFQIVAISFLHHFLCIFEPPVLIYALTVLMFGMICLDGIQSKAFPCIVLYCICDHDMNEASLEREIGIITFQIIDPFIFGCLFLWKVSELKVNLVSLSTDGADFWIFPAFPLQFRFPVPTVLSFFEVAMLPNTLETECPVSIDYYNNNVWMRTAF